MPLGIGKTIKTQEGLDNLPSELKESIAKTPQQTSGIEAAGLNCDTLQEPIPLFNRAACEVVYEGKNNAWIVLGRDRPASRASGYGGRGATAAGSIDIVVGRMSSVGPKSNVWVEPNMASDAARILISQKTDVDTNFGLVKGSVGIIRTRSAVAIKADAVRIMSRDGGIKLVTSLDGVNSHGGKAGSTSGIDLIAGNDDEPEQHFSADRGFYHVERLQPIVKGYNLAECLKQMLKMVEDLNGICDNLVTNQMQMNAALQLHQHEIMPVSGPALISVELQAPAILTMIRNLSFVKAALWTNKINLMATGLNYLEPYSSTVVYSRYNKTN